MWRTHTCGELRLSDAGKNVTISGWIQKIRDKGGLIWIDLRDRYGITQIILEEGESDQSLIDVARSLGREFVVQVSGEVIERLSKNPKNPTGDIEVKAEIINVLNPSKTPPFTIEDETDGGDELRMKYRYLDLRRNNVRNKLQLRHELMLKTREYLSKVGFIEVETPVLIKSTPEGARDFVVPSRMNPGEFYALPQSPQTFKQLLMISGFDKYFQLVKCFRDEDLRADRQPEFTQIDCEMSFVERQDVLNTFEGLVKNLFSEVLEVDLPDFPVMTYKEAMDSYGNDKPDLRFGMPFVNLGSLAKNKDFNVFNSAESVLAICVEGASDYTRKQIDQLTDWVKRPQVGARGLVYAKYNSDGTLKSSVDKFYDEHDLKSWFAEAGGKEGDLLLILAGDDSPTRFALSELRLYMGDLLDLKPMDVYKPLWVVDFPLLEWDEETKRFYAMHHPFTSPKPEDLDKLESHPGEVSANAYDLVINGTEIGGGSIRIHDRKVQERMFDALGFSKEEANEQFGFLMEAFEYGAPPHGGIAFGFDRLCSLMGGSTSIRDYIAFPKNNSGRDLMIDTPAKIAQEQLEELAIEVSKKLKDS